MEFNRISLPRRVDKIPSDSEKNTGQNTNLLDADDIDVFSIDSFQMAGNQFTDSKLPDENVEKLKLLQTKSIDVDEYTILTKNERTVLALLLSTIGLCSSLSMPIYWAALTDMSKAFNTTEERINYTVTSYLCFQAVAPVFVSSLSDKFGRRPIMLICVAGGIATNIGLACSRKYWLIVFLRCVLATFLAPLVSITSASVGDFTTRRNRGGLAGLTSGFILIGQGLAPFLGAVMDSVWSWPAIFWFSAALEGVIFIIAFIMLPETLRNLVGDMSIKPKLWIHRSLTLWYFKDRIKEYDESKLNKVHIKYEPWKSLRLIFKISVFYVLLPSSILFSTWTISQTTLSVHLARDYHYSTLDVGLCFFAPGAATISGTIFSGKLLDNFYKKRKKAYDMKLKSDLETLSPLSIPPFNIIYVRLFYIPFAGLFVIMPAVVFGWCIEYKVNIGCILVMCFLITFFCMIPLNTASTVLVDMFPQMSGGATALNNLFRCGMSAIFVSCLTKMEKSMSVGGTYTFMAGISFVSLAFILLLMKKSEGILIQNRNKKLGL